ncbi:hypothetical protein FRC03_007477, partial [Tulasnella sp. 419]
YLRFKNRKLAAFKYNQLELVNLTSSLSEIPQVKENRITVSTDGKKKGNRSGQSLFKV